MNATCTSQPNLYVEEGYALPGLQLRLAEKEKTSHVSGLCTVDGLQEICDGKTLSTVDMVLPFVESLIDKSNGFKTSSNLTRVSMQYTDIV